MKAKRFVNKGKIEKLLKECFEANLTISETAEILNSYGLKTKNGLDWSPAHVSWYSTNMGLSRLDKKNAKRKRSIENIEIRNVHEKNWTKTNLILNIVILILLAFLAAFWMFYGLN